MTIDDIVERAVAKIFGMSIHSMLYELVHEKRARDEERAANAERLRLWREATTGKSEEQIKAIKVERGEIVLANAEEQEKYLKMAATIQPFVPCVLSLPPERDAEEQARSEQSIILDDPLPDAESTAEDTKKWWEETLASRQIMPSRLHEADLPGQLLKGTAPAVPNEQPATIDPAFITEDGLGRITQEARAIIKKQTEGDRMAEFFRS